MNTESGVNDAIGTAQIGFSTSIENGETVYEITYDGLATEPTPRPFRLPDGETVSLSEQTLKFPNGDMIPLTEAAFEAKADTLRIRHDRSLSGKVSRATKRALCMLLERVRADE